MRADIRQTPEAKHLRCILDGEDISSDCVAADEELGLAICLKKDADGRIALKADKSGPEYEQRHGKVQLLFAGDLTDAKCDLLTKLFEKTDPIGW